MEGGLTDCCDYRMSATESGGQIKLTGAIDVRDQFGDRGGDGGWSGSVQVATSEVLVLSDHLNL